MAQKDDWHLTDDLHAESGKGDPFAAAMRGTRMPMLITNPRLPDNPIVFANDSFFDLTGYSREEVIGHNCRFLQGKDTDREVVRRIREAIEARRDVKVDILNYRKDGTPFWNALFLSPVSNEAGELQFFFASQLDISDLKAVDRRVREERASLERAVQERTAELEEALSAKTLLLHEVDHRVKNNLQMIAALIDIQSRAIADESVQRSLREMLGRIEALGAVHRRLYQSDNVATFDVGAFARELVGDLVEALGHTGINVEFEVEPVEIASSKAAPIGLLMNELVTNALKHGFRGRPHGTLTIEVVSNQQGFRIVVADDGEGMEPAAEGRFGQRLVKALSRQVQADIVWSDGNPGTRVTVNVADT